MRTFKSPPPKLLTIKIVKAIPFILRDFSHLRKIYTNLKLKYILPHKYDRAAPFEERNDEILRRKYRSISQYIKHQKSKFNLIENNLIKKFDMRVEMFYKRFNHLFGSNSISGSVLCLGARDGAEVESLRKYGLLAIGIDIKYPKDSPYVHFGDFHHIPYPNNCFDYAYMNCFDHVYDPVVVLGEIYRILRTKLGILVLDLVDGEEETENKSQNWAFESLIWKKKQQIIDLVEKHGFSLTTENRLDSNWTQYIFQKKVQVGPSLEPLTGLNSV
jgi:SAM-dependent methyltransferase